MLMGISMALGVLLLAMVKDHHAYDVFVCIVIVLISAGFLAEMVKNRRFRVCQIPIVLGYFFRLALLFYDVYSSDPFNLPLVGGPMTSDPLGFYNSALLAAQGQPFSYGGNFPAVMGAVFALTGASRLWAEYLVMLISVGTMLVVAQTFSDLKLSRRSSRLGMLFYALMPNFALLSVIFRRETLIALFVALSVMYFVRWAMAKEGDRPFVLCILFSLMASLFHSGTGLIAVGYLGFRVLYDRRTCSFRLKTANVVAGVFFLLAFMVVMSRYGSVFFAKLERLENGVASVSSVRDAGGSSYARYVGDSRTPLRMALFTVPRLMYFMFSPFPWQWRGMNDIITFIMSSCMYLFVLADAVRCIRRFDRQKRALVIMLVCTAMLISFVFSWGVTNTGTATRHRDKFLALYAVVFALCRDVSVRKVRRRRSARLR